MIHPTSPLAITIFCVFVGAVLALSFYLGAKAKSAKGYYAAHGQVGWFVNGIAFAGDYLSAASFLGICGMIAFYGYDGFLYSIGYLAGWIVALFVIAEPIKRLGKFTFADALDAQFHSRGIKLTAAISTLVVSVFYLIPQMVGAGALIKPLLGLEHHWGVLIVGAAVVIIVVTAGMVSTTWVQFIKGSLLVIFCFVLTVLILKRGLVTPPPQSPAHNASTPHVVQFDPKAIIPPEGAWTKTAIPLLRVRQPDGGVKVYRVHLRPTTRPYSDGEYLVSETQFRTVISKKGLFTAPTFEVNGRPQSRDNDLYPVGTIARLQDGKDSTGSLGPFSYFAALDNSVITTWPKMEVKESDELKHEIYYPVDRKGPELLTPGGSPTFASVRKSEFKGKLNFLSLMLALFCGTAALPHILIRYYTVKDAAAARKSTVVGIASIGFFYVLTLYLGLGAMTSGTLDPTDNNMSAPLLAKSFNPFLFAVISAIAFTTVLGTVSGLIMAASGAVAHDIMTNFMQMNLDDDGKVRAGKICAVFVGIIAIVLGIVFKNFNVTFLVGWAFNIAASANLPALVMLLFWRGTTKQGITAAITVGLLSSLGWIMLSQDAYQHLYKCSAVAAAKLAPAPFNQPGIVTIPLGFLVLIAVSLVTKGKHRAPQ